MIRFKPVLAILAVLLAVGCSKKPSGDSQEGASSDATKVTFNVKGMT